MRDNIATTEYVTSLARWQQLLNSKEFQISQVMLANTETLLVSYTKTSEFVVPTKNTNVVIAAFTTALARLHLYKFLDLVGKNTHYYDTDSIIYTHPIGKDPLKPYLKDHLGMLTNELASEGPDVGIAEFVSGGPKNYAFRLTNGKTVCKVRGITLNYSASQLLNFDSLRDFIVDTNRRGEIIVPGSTITRDKKTGALKNKDCAKTYKFAYDKNVLLCDDTTCPYGYMDRIDVWMMSLV